MRHHIRIVRRCHRQYLFMRQAILIFQRRNQAFLAPGTGIALKQVAEIRVALRNRHTPRRFQNDRQHDVKLRPLALVAKAHARDRLGQAGAGLSG